MPKRGQFWAAVDNDDDLKSINVVRHVLDTYDVGYPKTTGLAVLIGSAAPWCTVNTGTALSHDPVDLSTTVDGFDLVIDTTGIFSITATLAEACARAGVALISAALYHQGAILRIRRQTPEDTPILSRATNPRYLVLPPDQIEADAPGYLELGCTAPVHNAPPVNVLRASADISTHAIDHLTGRSEMPDETVTVIRPLSSHPFTRLGDVPGTNIGGQGAR